MSGIAPAPSPPSQRRPVWRRQVPVVSPLSPGGLARAALAALTRPDTARERLRAHLAERFHADEVVLAGSGTQALQLALVAARGRERGGPAPVALPAYSCYDLVSAAVGAAAPVLFYDLDPVSLTPEPESVREALASGARTVVAAPLHGFPLEWDAVRAICGEAGAMLVEDAAQALGSRHGGREGGSFGDLTVLSFGRGKGWTGGSGGALLVRRGSPAGVDVDALLGEALAPTPRAAGARAFATSWAQWTLGRPWLYRLPTSVPGLALGETRYEEPVPPVRMSAFATASALRHAETALEAARHRRVVAETWGALLETAGPTGEHLTPCRPTSTGEAGWLRYPVLARDGSTAERFARDGAPFGVVRGYPLPLPDLPAARTLLLRQRRNFAGARRLADTLLTLPTHEHVGAADVRGVEAALHRFAAPRAAGAGTPA